MIRSRSRELTFRSKRRWVIVSQCDPVGYLRWLSSALPERSVLYFEGVDVSQAVAKAFRRFKAMSTTPVMRNTLYPSPRCFHVTPSEELFEILIAVAATGRLAEICDHLHVYRRKTMLIYGHDAFTENRTLLSPKFTLLDIRMLRRLAGVEVLMEEK